MASNNTCIKYCENTEAAFYVLPKPESAAQVIESLVLVYANERYDQIFNSTLNLYGQKYPEDTRDPHRYLKWDNKFQRLFTIIANSYQTQLQSALSKELQEKFTDSEIKDAAFLPLGFKVTKGPFPNHLLFTTSYEKTVPIHPDSEPKSKERALAVMTCCDQIFKSVVIPPLTRDCHLVLAKEDFLRT